MTFPYWFRAWVLRHRTRLIAATHLAMFGMSWWLAFALRLDFQIIPHYRRIILLTIGYVLIVKLVVFYFFNLFQGWWRYVSLRDLVQIAAATTVSMLIIATGAFTVYGRIGFPRSVPFLDWFLTMLMVGGARAGLRLIREGSFAPWRARSGDPIFIAGAGDAGESLLREIDRRPEIAYEVVGFLDDAAHKAGSRIHGVPVVGKVGDAGRLAARLGVKEVLIAMPSATGRQMREVVRKLQEANLGCKTLPGMNELIDGRVSFSHVRPVDITDLLGREPVDLDQEAVGRFLAGRTVMVTGAGGSIGSEICRQVLRFGPRRLVLLERSELSLFEVERQLKAAYPDAELEACLADVCDAGRIAALFSAHRPEVVFHAAAYKHVPMLEYNPGEAVKNNVVGTRTLADLAAKHDVDSFVMISTDKAVRPASVMGAAKRLAEIYVQALSGENRTKFVTVRFGNVIGSAGSAIPIFQKQILAGGPVTVTHPEMRRYFMTIPEASQLVLQAGAMGKGGEIFVLDMGEPVLIRELAEELIRLSGLEPGEDIEISYTGLRPGEKLSEELHLEDEAFAPTPHPKITVLQSSPAGAEKAVAGLAKLAETADTAAPEELRKAIMALVPELRGE